MTNKATIYFEAHVTIEPVFDDERVKAAEIAGLYGFRLADLLMRKRKEDTEERSKDDTFMTGRSQNRGDIFNRTKGLVLDLQKANFKVWRYKIEDTIIDSRSGDEWGLLEPENTESQ